VFTTAGRVRQLGPWETAEGARAALGRIVPTDGASRTWDAVERAATSLDDAAGSRQVVLITSSAGTSTTSPSAAAAELRRVGAALRAVALGAADLDALVAVVEAAGGSVQTASSDAQLPRRLEDVAAQIAGRYRLTADAGAAGTASGAGVEELTVAAGGARATVEVEPGDLRAGSAELAVGVESSQGLVARLTSNGTVVGVAALAGVAALVFAVWTLLGMVVPDENGLRRRLEAYEEAPVEADPTGDQRGAMATVPLLQRAVDLTGEVAQKRGALERLEVKLERANLPLRAAEALFFALAAAVVIALLALVVTRNPLVFVLALVVGLVLPQALLNVKIRKRQKAFEAQLPDMLSLMAGTLRAGYSIGQGFEAVSTEIDDPMGRELRRVVSENRLGRPLDEALDAVAERMGSDDFAWAVMAIKIQREVGGNLAELLLTVSNTMTQRERLRRDVNTLTAEGRMSAIVLGLLPPGLGAVMFAMNPDYISKLFEGGLGMGMLALAVVAMGVGFAWMQKIIKIEV
jgi:tight adherence protein B